MQLTVNVDILLSSAEDTDVTAVESLCTTWSLVPNV
jgi:hypothetical protein